MSYSELDSTLLQKNKLIFPQVKQCILRMHRELRERGQATLPGSIE